MLKRLKEIFTGWSEDEYCRVCGEKLQSWGMNTRSDPQTGKVFERTTYKCCMNSYRHVWFEKVEEVDGQT